MERTETNGQPDDAIAMPTALVDAPVAAAKPSTPAPARYLSRDAILAIDDTKYEDVLVEEWNNSIVRVKSITSGERDALEASCMVPDPTAPKNKPREKFSTLNFRAKLVCRAAVDSEGRPLFGPNDHALLALKSASAVTKIADVAMRLSKISDDDVEAIAKNFETDRDGDSSSE